MSKLVAVSGVRCAGLYDPKDPKQIEFNADEGAHDVPVQHFEDGTTRVLCSYFKGALCRYLHEESKDGESKDGEYKVVEGSVRCPFKVD